MSSITAASRSELSTHHRAMLDVMNQSQHYRFNSEGGIDLKSCNLSDCLDFCSKEQLLTLCKMALQSKESLREITERMYFEVDNVTLTDVSMTVQLPSEMIVGKLSSGYVGGIHVSGSVHT